MPFDDNYHPQDQESFLDDPDDSTTRIIGSRLVRIDKHKIVTIFYDFLGSHNVSGLKHSYSFRMNHMQ